MTIKFRGQLAGADTEINFVVLAFERVTGVYPEDMMYALRHNGYYANVWAVTDNVIYLEVDDFLPLEKIEQAFKDYGL